jgi:hypothetical protein
MLNVNGTRKNCDFIRKCKMVQISRATAVIFVTVKYDVLRSQMLRQVPIFFLKRYTKNLIM